MGLMQNHMNALGIGGLLFAGAFAAHGCGGSSGSGPVLIPATTCNGTFTACGGDPTGTWDIASICVEGDLTAAYNAEMSADYPACGSTFISANVAGAGSVTYGAGNFSFNATMQAAMSLAYTPDCVSAASGGATSSASTCGQTAATLDNEPETAATCSYTGTNCNCSMTITHANTDSGLYTVSDSTIAESGGSTYTFCVNGNTMIQREQISGNAYGVTTMKKR
jgi:hypothetical protein